MVRVLSLRDHMRGIDISLADTKTWSPTINALVEEGTVGLGPYDLILNYDYWTYSKKT
jgi:tRNA (guanine37-N1)-methyltransferase